MTRPLQIQCPKCSSNNVEVRRERTGWSTGETAFHCRSCGKVLYGKFADEEVQRQRDAWQEQKARDEVVSRALRKFPSNLFQHNDQARAFVEGHINDMKALREEVESNLKVVARFVGDAPVRLHRKPSDVAQGQLNLVNLDKQKILRIFDEMSRLLRKAVESGNAAVVAKAKGRFGELYDSFLSVKASQERCMTRFNEALGDDPTLPRPVPVQKIVEGKRPPQVKVSRPAETAPSDGLESKSLEYLRKYASNELGIVGASKIPGGKAALLERIRSVLAPEEPPARHPSLDALSERPLSYLRKYARNELGIVGASKIPGGKEALLDRINQALV